MHFLLIKFDWARHRFGLLVERPLSPAFSPAPSGGESRREGGVEIVFVIRVTGGL